MSLFGKRMTIVETAIGEIGHNDFRKYYDGVVTESNVGHLDWCGIFDLWVYHQNGILTEVTWKLGLGFLMVPPHSLPMTNEPEPGDVAYFAKNQHHALVEAVFETEVHLINGNGLGGQVTRSKAPRASVTAFFSVTPYLKDSVFPEAIV